MDIKKELLKLKKARTRNFIIIGVLFALCFPIFMLGCGAGFIQIMPIGGLFSVIIFILLLRNLCHPNYYNLKGELAGYERCHQLHVVPPVGESEELDEKIRQLDAEFFRQGAVLLNYKFKDSDMGSEKASLIKRTITQLGEIDKASDEALFMTYAHLCEQAKLGGIAKNKHAPIQKECVFRILYSRYYHLLKE